MAEGSPYRAVFLRMHPTGKAVRSLTEASQGREGDLARIAAGELGIPPEDIKVVHEDTDRFGDGYSFNHAPSDAVADNVAITARRLRPGGADRRADARVLAGRARLGGRPSVHGRRRLDWTHHGSTALGRKRQDRGHDVARPYQRPQSPTVSKEDRTRHSIFHRGRQFVKVSSGSSECQRRRMNDLVRKGIKVLTTLARC